MNPLRPGLLATLVAPVVAGAALAAGSATPAVSTGSVASAAPAVSGVGARPSTAQAGPPPTGTGVGPAAASPPSVEPAAPEKRLPLPLPTGATGPTASTTVNTGTAGRHPWEPPVAPFSVLRGFDAPAQRWLPGHRGVDLGAAEGARVRSPTDGTVAFVGTVAGKPVVSLDHSDPDGSGTLRTTYEPVTASVRRGDRVRTGDVVGAVARGSHCTSTCLHWGAKRGDDYVDPLLFLRQPVRLWTPRHSTG